MKIILASSSPRRQQLLKQIGIDFEVREASFAEQHDTSLSVHDTAVFNAKGKALSVKADETALIIAADTIVSLQNSVMGKPENSEDAKKMLENLSGNTHEVYTGVCVRYMDKLYCDAEVTQVKMRTLSSKEIDSYVATKEPLDKAGSYGVQGKGALLVEKINGCYYNVVGLPLVCLMKLLKKAGFDFEYKKHAGR